MATKQRSGYYKCQRGTCYKLGAPPECAHETGGPGPVVDRALVTKAAPDSYLAFVRGVDAAWKRRMDAWAASSEVVWARAQHDEAAAALRATARAMLVEGIIESAHAEAMRAVAAPRVLSPAPVTMMRVRGAVSPNLDWWPVRR